MTTLIACLSTGKGTWGHVSNLMHQEAWEHIFLITNSFGKEKFTHEKPFTPVVIDTNASAATITTSIQEELKGKIPDTEVALNIISGAGNEHMGLLSALLKLGLGIRLVVVDEEQMQEL